MEGGPWAALFLWRCRIRPRRAPDGLVHDTRLDDIDDFLLAQDYSELVASSTLEPVAAVRQQDHPVRANQPLTPMDRPIALGIIAALLLTGCMSAPPPASPPPDSRAAAQRVVVQLTPDEREHVLGEMRDLLVALQGVTDGLARDDFGAVAAAARRVGAGAEGGQMPPAIAKKLPPEFRQLGRATREQFDALAADAGRRDARHSLAQTSALMQRCNACHAVYQFPG